MTQKAFKELYESKTKEEFSDWFRENATYEIQVGGAYICCVPLSSKVVGFRDGTIYHVQPQNKFFSSDGSYSSARALYIDTYDTVSILNRFALDQYASLIKDKDIQEKRLKKIGGDKNEEVYCSFCGKESSAVKRLIAAPGYVYICNECVGICNDILADEDMKDSFPFKNPDDDGKDQSQGNRSLPADDFMNPPEP